MNRFTLEELAKHHEATGSKVSEYVAASDYDAIKAERDALATQVETLKYAAFMAVFYITNPVSKGRLRDALNLTPQQPLAEIRAEAYEKGFIQGVKFSGSGFVSESDHEEAKAYGDEIRQGGAK